MSSGTPAHKYMLSYITVRAGRRQPVKNFGGVLLQSLFRIGYDANNSFLLPSVNTLTVSVLQFLKLAEKPLPSGSPEDCFCRALARKSAPPPLSSVQAYYRKQLLFCLPVL